MFIVLGVLVCLIGFLGTVGGIFVQLLCGRIVLRIVSYEEGKRLWLHVYVSSMLACLLCWLLLRLSVALQLLLKVTT